MECLFVGAFTDEEQARIRGSLEALGEAVRALGGEGEEERWRVERRRRWRRGTEEEEAFEFDAVHVESSVRFWGDSAEDLARSIDVTAAHLRRRG